MSQMIDWDAVREEFISGTDHQMLATTLGISEKDLMAAAEKQGWITDAIAQKKQRVQERAALGEAGTLDEAVREDDLVVQAVTKNFKNVILKVGQMMSGVTTASQLRHLVDANSAAYSGYKEIRGLDEDLPEDGDELGSAIREAQRRNRALAHNVIERLEHKDSITAGG